MWHASCFVISLNAEMFLFLHAALQFFDSCWDHTSMLCKIGSFDMWPIRLDLYLNTPITVWFFACVTVTVSKCHAVHLRQFWLFWLQPMTEIVSGWMTATHQGDEWLTGLDFGEEPQFSHSCVETWKYKKAIYFAIIVHISLYIQ